jgi:DNA-binding NtrC family response regulator
VEIAASGREALETLAGDDGFDLILTDIKMPEMDGLALLARIREKDPDILVIMITAYGSIETAVEAMKHGAADYLLKPFDPEQLSLLIEKTQAHKAVLDENVALKEQLAERSQGVFEDLVAGSEAMAKVFDLIEDVAATDTPVLITGETGTGKELVARAIHARSGRAFGPFVAINCGAQTESLLESELFGHERGAFTGAVAARRGRLEMADNGTLFLDEVGEIPSKMQVDLLRVLEEKAFNRIGGTENVETDFRLLCATHRDLQALINTGDFRQDFFYRINVISIPVPPLRERTGDVFILAEYFLDRFSMETGKRLEGITPEAHQILSGYDWPGNVRELRNVIERAVVISRGKVIGAEELTFLRPGQEDCSGPLTLKEMEIRHIKATLMANQWNVSQSAKVLGIDRVTLSRKIKRHGLIRPA